MPLTDKLQLLSGLLKINCGKSNNNTYFPSEGEIANQDWAASHFFYRLLQFARFPSRPTPEAFNTFKTEYSEKNEIYLDTNSLLSRYWIRHFGGEVRRANA